MAHDVQHAALPQARGFLLVLEGDGDFHVDLCPLGHAKEIGVHGAVGHGVQLKITAQHLLAVAFDFHLEQRGKKAGLHARGAQLRRVDRDGFGVLVRAVDHSGHAPVATFCPSGPLADSCARFRIKRNGIGHFLLQ